MDYYNIPSKWKFIANIHIQLEYYFVCIVCVYSVYMDIKSISVGQSMELKF